MSSNIRRNIMLHVASNRAGLSFKNHRLSALGIRTNFGLYIRRVNQAIVNVYYHII